MSVPSFLSNPGPDADDAYARAGVDLAARNVTVQQIKSIASRASRPEVLGGVGAFSGLFKLGTYREPVLASSTDGVGTKLRIALLMERYDAKASVGPTGLTQVLGPGTTGPDAGHGVGAGHLFMKLTHLML